MMPRYIVQLTTHRGFSGELRLPGDAIAELVVPDGITPSEVALAIRLGEVELVPAPEAGSSAGSRGGRGRSPKTETAEATAT